MTVDSLRLEDFRNYTALEAQFDPRLNVVCGENAQGKTNLLEAIAYLSTGRSHRARYDRELIRLEADRALACARIAARDRTFLLEAKLRRGAARQLRSNGVRLKNAGELSGVLTTVLFCPEDLSLIRAGAAERRRFLDDCICQLRPRYATALAEYRRLWEHKTRILRDWPDCPSLLDALDDFSLRMAQVGAVVVHYRAHFIRRLAGIVAEIHGDFSGGGERLELRYQTVSAVADPLAPAKELLPQLLSHQASRRTAELDSRQCLSGPHKDDLEVLLDGMSAKTYGSQGQTRTAALSLKLASRELFYQDTEQWPVLLLDDVLSELDRKRQEFVLNRIRGGQVFLTCCEEEKTGLLTGGRVLRVKHGQIV